MSDKFPSIDDVHEVLSDLTNLFDDRNALLDSMFKDDKYKDFLVAENMQQLAEADKRDDSANGRIKRDLASGYEVLKARTTMQKFANFISPGSLPSLDLSSEDDFEDDGLDYDDQLSEEKEEVVQPEDGKDGKDGKDGADATVQAPSNRVSGFDHIALPGGSQSSGLKLAEGGAVSPSPMQNFLNPSAQRPETKSGVKSLESLGLVGKKNVASELTGDLGLEAYKKALADAMALPLKAVAAGLAGLLDNIDVPGGEGAALEGQVSSIGKAFDVTTSKKKKKEKEKEDKGNPLLGIAKMLLPFGLGAKKPKPKSYSISSSNSFSIDGAGNIIDEKSSYSDSRDQPQGGPSLTPHPGTLMGWGGASHETKAPDQLSSQGDTRMDSIKNSISNITQGAKNMFMKGTTIGRAAGAAGGFITKMLGKVQPAAEGSQYSKQDINSLTNQVIEGNEAFMTQKTQMNVQVGASTEQDGQAAMLAAIAKMSKTSLGINEGDPVPSAALIPSKHLLHSITIVDGGKTPHDIA
jgi:hypothetical protein